MISAFQSREFGFGMDLTKEEVNIVNAFRKGKKYVDEAAAQKRLGSPLKPPSKLIIHSMLNWNMAQIMKGTGTMSSWFYN